VTYISKYPIINVTVDVILDLYMIDEHQRYILLIERANEPFKGKLALPGGFIDPDEPAETAAVRELEEETGFKIDEDVLELVDVASAPNRDPRGRTISIVYSYFIIGANAEGFKLNLKAGDDAANVVLLPVQELKKEDLAFDHYDLIGKVHDIAGSTG
jgi:8-oxo-dGTP diphosphatase